MKQGAPRGGTVDGIRKDTMRKMAETIGVTEAAFSKAAQAHGLAFTYHGHAITLDPSTRRSPLQDDEAETASYRRRRKPIDPTAIALKARCNYNEHGVAARGLLMRKAY